MIRIYASFLLLTGITLAHSQIVDIPDANFKNALLNHDPVIDTNGDGEIQLSEAIATLRLSIYNQNISDLEGIQSFAMLERLYCDRNSLTSIDVSSNPLLVELAGWQNSITSIDVSANPLLRFIDFGNNPITNVDLSGNPNLDGVFFYNSPLQYINIRNGNNVAISQLHVYGTPTICIQVDNEGYANSRMCDPTDDWGWCKDASDYYSENCNLGIEENVLQGIQIAPNPVNDILTISNHDELFLTSISIYNVIGEILAIQRSDFNRIDLSHLNSGVYFVAFESSGNVFTKKIIKK